MDRIEEVLAKYSTPSLRRNILTEDGKRWQLWGKGIRGPGAEELIRKIYVEQTYERV